MALLILNYILELSIGFAQNVSVPESENARLCITFSSAFLTNFRINVGPLLQHNLTFPGIGKSILYEWGISFLMNTLLCILCCNIKLTLLYYMLMSLLEYSSFEMLSGTFWSNMFLYYYYNE